ncbi:MAG: Fic family protein [Bacteroides sp.]|nr:Fic family protein [Bacteroides sp.]
MAYNSNKIEGSTLTEDQTAALEEGFLPKSEDVYRARDIEEMNGHFLMFNHMLSSIDEPLSEERIKEFHYELIHPFQDGNGRTGRIILFRECLANDMDPFIVQDKNQAVYITALKKAQTEKDCSDLVKYFESEQKEYMEHCRYFSVEERYSECVGL